MLHAKKIYLSFCQSQFLSAQIRQGISLQILLMKFSFCFICLLFSCFTFSQDLIQKKDIIYANALNWQNKDKELKLDIIYPSNEKKLPIIVYLHGDGFLYGSKEPDSAFCQRLAKAGFLVANVSIARVMAGRIKISSPPLLKLPTGPSKMQMLLWVTWFIMLLHTRWILH